MKSRIGPSFILALALAVGDIARATEIEKKNKQALATSPKALVEMLAEKSFMPPEEYERKLHSERSAHYHSVGLEQLPQVLDAETDPRRGITSEQIEDYARVLTDIARESKRDGEILWGRLQGSPYERKALRWIAKELESMGLKEVHHDSFPSGFPQWRPSACDLSVVAAPGFGEGDRYEFRDAVTAFVSATTPKGGLRAPVVYVGDGTAAELQGRNVEGRIVLLRGRT